MLFIVSKRNAFSLKAPSRRSRVLVVVRVHCGGGQGRCDHSEPSSGPDRSDALVASLGTIPRSTGCLGNILTTSSPSSRESSSEKPEGGGRSRGSSQQGGSIALGGVSHRLEVCELVGAHARRRGDEGDIGRARIDCDHASTVQTIDGCGHTVQQRSTNTGIILASLRQVSVDIDRSRGRGRCGCRRRFRLSRTVTTTHLDADHFGHFGQQFPHLLRLHFATKTVSRTASFPSADHASPGGPPTPGLLAFQSSL